MKMILVLITCSICLWFCNMGTDKDSISKTMVSHKSEPVNFKTQVQPILKNNCSPCHFPGGKLYEKLPFDKSETIVNHTAGILKRIKKEGESDLIKRFAAQNKVVALK